MKNYQVTTLLATLAPKEINRLDLFLRAEYFNSSQTIRDLFVLLKAYHPNYKEADLDLKALYDFLFPGNTYQPGTMRNLMAELTELVRKFLRQLELEGNPALEERLLLKQLAKRKVGKAFTGLYTRVKKRNASARRSDRIIYLEEYLSLEQFYHFPYTDRRNISAEHMTNRVQHLDRFFTLSKLLMRIEMNSRKQLLGEEIPYSIFDSKLEAYIQDLPIAERPLFQLLQLLSNLQTHPDKRKIKKATEIYFDQYIHFSGFDNKVILKTLINLMSRIFKDRDSNYLKHMFRLYDFGIEKKILIYDSSLTLADFVNIVNTATRSGEKAWAQRFVNKNLRYLPKADQFQVRILSRAMIDFERGEFSQIISTLNTTKFTNPKLGFRYRHLLIKCYVELTLLDKMDVGTTLKHLNVLDRFIRRQAEKGTIKRAAIYLDFVKITLKILRAHEKQEKANIKALRKAIQEKPSLNSRYWLLQKIKSLK